MVDGDVHKNAAGLHLAKHLAGDEFRGGSAGDKDGADDEVDAG